MQDNFDIDREKNELFDSESKYLEQTLDFLKARIEYLRKNNYKRELESIELKRQAYEAGLEKKEINANGFFDSAMVQNDLLQQAEIMQYQSYEAYVLERLIKRPYFGHFTFVFSEDRENSEIYVGLKDVVDLENYKQYIVDWRAPIASLYYDYSDLGPAEYYIQGNVQKGEIKAKYQLIIKHSKLLNVLNTAEQINDEVLQVVLSQLGTARMQNIVATIQAEQNKIIRSEINRSLLVQGVAGSGKTSIALHRAAYMLYSLPKLQAVDMVLISPSASFAAYLMSVLPSLGEKNINYMTIETVLKTELSDVFERYNRYKFLEPSREKTSSFSSFETIDYVNEFAEFLSKSIFIAEDIVLEDEEITVPKRELQLLYSVNFAHLPTFARKKALLEQVQDFIADNKVFSENQDEIVAAIDSMYALNSIRDIYRVFSQWLKSEKDISVDFSHEQVDLIDLALMALLKIKLYGSSETDWVKHIIVDEMQDLLPIEHEVIRLLFQCPRTILGDENQAVRYHLPNNYLEKLRELYTKDKLRVDAFRLNKSYRSTSEITNFSKRILQIDSIQAIDRHGEEVEIKEFAEHNWDAAYKDIYETLLQWRKQGLNTAAVIAKGEAELKEFSTALSGLMSEDTANEDILTNEYLREEQEFAVTLCDIANSKGIEFDAVIILNVSDELYNSDLDRTKLYVACTRALHVLKLYSVGKRSTFI